jgi:4-diphosphocytidyl-2-C-methyl-D-erythritol kinase
MCPDPRWTTRFAPAKVNLFLHVGPLAADGYHPVCSLMVFADVGDRVSLRDHSEMAFRLEGPFASALESDPDNLVTRARDRLIAAASVAASPFEIVLEKDLPIAAGLGGGSADAAAALALIGERLAAVSGAPVDHERIGSIARALGADVTACLESRSVIGRGRGDDISAAPVMPPLDAVLVNPRAPAPTGAVYRAFDQTAFDAMADEPVLPASFASSVEVIAFLERTRNDLERPAVTVQPLIGDVLAALAAAPETRLARMSGSGATCFALCEGPGDAEGLARRLAGARPDWWVRACRFG